MKKIITTALAITMMAALSTTAFAASGSGTVTSQPGSQDIDVQAKYVDQSFTVDTYSVDVSWGAMEFDYNVEGDLTWNPETHAFDDNTTARWTENGNDITVTNHSSSVVAVNMNFTAEAEHSTVTGIFSEPQFTLDSAVGKPVNEAASQTTTLTLDGPLAETMTTLGKVGLVTVTIS